MPDPQIDIRGFCQPPELEAKHDCRKPWSFDGFTYATDLAIVIRVNKIAALAGDQDHELLADIAKHLRGIPDETTGIRWEASPTVPDPSKVCDSWWRTLEQCETCNGNHTGACEECAGQGKSMRKINDDYRSHSQNGLCLGRRYLWMISKLPNCKVCADGRNPELPLLSFRCDGGIGCLAGKR